MAWPKRQKRLQPNRHEDGTRASIGDFYVDQACTALNKAAERECALYLERFEAANILNWFFDDDLLRRLRMVKDVIPVSQHWQNYTLVPRVALYIDFKKLAVPTILPSVYRPDPVKCLPIIEAAQKAQDIQRKYARVKHMLRWFNRNATPGAVRAFWPSVLALCPQSPSLRDMDTAPTRYDTPRDIGKLLPLIRETSGTVAAMELLPGDVEPRPRGDVWFSLDALEEDFDGARYGVEHLYINV